MKITNTNINKLEKTDKKKPKKEELNIEPKDTVEIGSGKEQDSMPDLKKAGKGVNLNFIHMNDFHGYVEEADKPEGDGIVGGLTRVAGEVKELKSKNPEGTLLLDGGDIYDGGFYSKFTKGEIVSKPYADMGFDAIAVGNHDVTWGLDSYAEIAKTTGADFLGANVTDLSPDASLKFVKPYKVIEKQGVKIGVLGLASPMTALSTPQKGILQIEDPQVTAKTYIEKMKKDDNVDMVVLLSHLGFDEDVKLAENLKGIDVIVGAHSHTPTFEAKKVGDTVIVQAGGEGKFVGDLGIVFDPSQKKILSYKENLIPITGDIKPDPSVSKIIAPYIDKYESVKNEVLGKTNKDLSLVQNKRTALTNLFVDAQKMDSDLSATSSFSIRKGIDKGDVTFGELFQMYPFDNELVQVKSKGTNVLRFLESGLRFLEGNNNDNYAIASGITYKYNPDLLDGKKITSVTMGGKTYTREEFEKKNLTVSMDNYTAGKSYFKECKVEKNYGKVFDILKDYIKENSPLNNLSDEKRVEKVSDVPEGAAIAGEKLGTVKQALVHEPGKFGNMAKFYGDALKGDADMSFGFTKSLTTAGLPAGEVLNSNLKKAYPFDNELLTVEASGKQIIDLLEYGRSDRFAGKEQVISSGINYTYDSSLPEGKRITSVTMGDKTYDRTKFSQEKFEVSMDNFLYDNKFKGATIKEERGSIYKALGEYLKKNSPLDIGEVKSPGVNTNTSAPTQAVTDPDRDKKILKMGGGKIKPDEVGQFSLSNVNIDVDGEKAFEKEKAMIGSAKKSVGVTMYTLTKDDMVDALISKAKEGVPVRVVVDPHIHTTPEKLAERMEVQEKLLKGGVKVMEDPGDHIFCNHSKTLSVDGKSAYVSKINWAPYSTEYHDYGASIEGGKAVNDVENFFRTTWALAGGKDLEQSPKNKDVENGVPIKVVFTNPDSPSRNTPFNNITNNLDEVGKSVKGQYFSLTSLPLVKKLISLKEKDPNKEIKIMLNESIFLESPQAQKYAKDLIDNGVEVKLYKDSKGKLHTLHAAATSFDNKEVSFGSANTTFGGLFSNREANVNIVGQESIKPMENQFDEDWKTNSRDVTPDDLKLADKAKKEEGEEKAKPYYDVPVEQISEALSIDKSRLDKAIGKICDILSYNEFKPDKALEIKLAVQKFAAMSYKDNKQFDTIMNRFYKLLEVEADDAKNPEKATKVPGKLINDVREALADYIIINNIATNNPKADIDDLTDKFVETFKSMNDPNREIDDTMDIRSKFAANYGIN